MLVYTVIVSPRARLKEDTSRRDKKQMPEKISGAKAMRGLAPRVF